MHHTGIARGWGGMVLQWRVEMLPFSWVFFSISFSSCKFLLIPGTGRNARLSHHNRVSLECHCTGRIGQDTCKEHPETLIIS